MGKLGKGKKSYLVRVFGENPLLAFDRKEENRVYAELSSKGIAPKLVATFGNGRIEDWVDGRPASAEECRDHRICMQVAQQLAGLHSFQPPASGVQAAIEAFDLNMEDNKCDLGPEANPDIWAWATARKWLLSACRTRDLLEEKAQDAANASERLRDAVERLQTLDLQQIVARAKALLNHMNAKSRELHVCFCHNDLSNTNVLWNAQAGRVRILDFEYGGINYRGFDLATHLSHWAGGAIDGLYNHAAFPAEEEQINFLEAYSESSRESASVGKLLLEVKNAAPLAHLVWGLWAVCMLPDALGRPEGKFSHIEYAERRLQAFQRSCDRINVL